MYAVSDPTSEQQKTEIHTDHRLRLDVANRWLMPKRLGTFWHRSIDRIVIVESTVIHDHCHVDKLIFVITRKTIGCLCLQAMQTCQMKRHFAVDQAAESIKEPFACNRN